MLVTKKRFDKTVASYEKTIQELEEDKALVEEQNDGLAKKLVELNELTDATRDFVDYLTTTSKGKMVEELEMLDTHIEILNDIIDQYEEEPALQASNALLTAFEEQVEKLPAQCSGVCTVKKDGKIESLKITGRDHARELLEQFKAGEMELVG